MNVELVKTEVLNYYHLSRFSESPHFLIHAAADPQYSIKYPGNPSPAVLRILNRESGRPAVWSSQNYFIQF